ERSGRCGEPGRGHEPWFSGLSNFIPPAQGGAPAPPWSFHCLGRPFSLLVFGAITISFRIWLFIFGLHRHHIRYHYNLGASDVIRISLIHQSALCCPKGCMYEFKSVRPCRRTNPVSLLTAAGSCVSQS